MKQETLEELAEKHAKEFPKAINDLEKVVEAFKRSSFITGFEKAKEIMYSEEEVLDLIKARQMSLMIGISGIETQLWFDPFRKK